MPPTPSGSQAVRVAIGLPQEGSQRHGRWSSTSPSRARVRRRNSLQLSARWSMRASTVTSPSSGQLCFIARTRTTCFRWPIWRQAQWRALTNGAANSIDGCWEESSAWPIILGCRQVPHRASTGILQQGLACDPLTYPKPDMPLQGTIHAVGHLTATGSIPRL